MREEIFAIASFFHIMKTSSTLSALLFDLDDTLLVDEEVSHEALEHVVEPVAAAYHLKREALAEAILAEAWELWREGPCYPFCRSIGICAFECLWGNFWGDSKELQALRTWSLSFRKEVFKKIMQPYEPDKTALLTLSEKMAHDFAHARRSRQRLFSETFSLIKNLSHHYKLALLTNGAPDLQREKIAASGLESFFSAIAISGEHGIGKPEPAIFHRLLEELQVKPQAALMIGNSLERDIAGAHAAGIRSVWMRLPGTHEEHEIKPDFTITKLEELLPILVQIA